jgi:hypothetical protein
MPIHSRGGWRAGTVKGTDRTHLSASAIEPPLPANPVGLPSCQQRCGEERPGWQHPQLETSPQGWWTLLRFEQGCGEERPGQQQPQPRAEELGCWPPSLSRLRPAPRAAQGRPGEQLGYPHGVSARAYREPGAPAVPAAAFAVMGFSTISEIEGGVRDAYDTATTCKRGNAIVVR